MRVNLYTTDTNEILPTGAANDTCAANVELSDVIERDDPEYMLALTSLQHIGRYWGGGGAAPLFLLMRAT